MGQKKKKRQRREYGMAGFVILGRVIREASQEKRNLSIKLKWWYNKMMINIDSVVLGISIDTDVDVDVDIHICVDIHMHEHITYTYTYRY